VVRQGSAKSRSPVRVWVPPPMSADVAQQAEQRIRNARVTGSIPVVGSIKRVNSQVQYIRAVVAEQADAYV
jgi:hypothetical protein